ncbi:MAG: 2-dehydropantoate 2-reductase [Pseudomonadota bacterium]
MKFLVVGPGAMGCLFAVRLKKAGHEVTLLDHRKERADLINHQGVLVEGITGEYREKISTVTEGPLTTPDFVLLCVKAYNTREAGLSMKQWIKGGAVIVTLQNGVGNLEILEEIYGRERVLGGVTAEGATLLGPGRIRHAGQGETLLGPAKGPDSPAEALVSALNGAGFNSRAVANAHHLIWGKLVINVGINALAAIVGVKNGRVPELSGTRKIMEEAVREAVAVTTAKGIQLPYPDPLVRVIEVCKGTSGNIASMLQDVLGEKPTEIDFINGAIVREGAALGIATPANHTLTCLVQAIQETYRERIR